MSRPLLFRMMVSVLEFRRGTAKPKSPLGEPKRDSGRPTCEDWVGVQNDDFRYPHLSSIK